VDCALGKIEISSFPVIADSDGGSSILSHLETDELIAFGIFDSQHACMRSNFSEHTSKMHLAHQVAEAYKRKPNVI
jgi:hypothetical protein